VFRRKTDNYPKQTSRKKKIFSYKTRFFFFHDANHFPSDCVTATESRILKKEIANKEQEQKGGARAKGRQESDIRTRGKRKKKTNKKEKNARKKPILTDLEKLKPAFMETSLVCLFCCFLSARSVI